VSHKENLSGIFKVIAPTVVDNPYGLPTPCAKDVDQRWSIWCAAARQVWIDQSQSLNSFYDPNEDFDSLGDRISANYFESWRCGVKTNYYLYSRASESEPQTLNKRVERDEKAPTDAPTQEEQLGGENWTGGRVCSIDAGPDCEACQ
jgi:ribonucleoside-diphosphate reductase alpha chain